MAILVSLLTNHHYSKYTSHGANLIIVPFCSFFALLYDLTVSYCEPFQGASINFPHCSKGIHLAIHLDGAVGLLSGSSKNVPYFTDTQAFEITSESSVSPNSEIGLGVGGSEEEERE